MTRYGYRIPAMNEKRWNFTGINKSWWCSTNVSQFFLFLVTWICWDLAGASWLTLQRAKLGGHLSSQVPSSSCWIHPFQVEEISPYPNLWLHSRFIFLDWLHLNFEEIVNRKRLTEQHFFTLPIANVHIHLAVCWWGFKLSSKETLNHGETLFLSFCF